MYDYDILLTISKEDNTEYSSFITTSSEYDDARGKVYDQGYEVDLADSQALQDYIDGYEVTAYGAITKEIARILSANIQYWDIVNDEEGLLSIGIRNSRIPLERAIELIMSKGIEYSIYKQYEEDEAETYVDVTWKVSHVEKDTESNFYKNESKSWNVYYFCPMCHNKSVTSIDNCTPDYHDLCICEECGAELLAEPQFDGSMKFVIDNVE